MAPLDKGTKPGVLTPAVLKLSKLLISGIPQKVDQCLVDIEDFFKTVMPKCSQMDMIVALSNLYFQKEFIGPTKAALRIILHFLVFLSRNSETCIKQDFGLFHQSVSISPAVAVLLKCYGTPANSDNSVFANMTNAERQFVGRLIGYTPCQRKILLYGETPKTLAFIENNDPQVWVASAMIHEPGITNRIAGAFKNINKYMKQLQMILSVENKCWAFSINPQQAVEFFAEDIEPLDDVPDRANDFAKLRHVPWEPVPFEYLDFECDAATVFAPTEHVELLQRQYEEREIRKRTSDEISVVIAEQIRQIECQAVQNKVHKELTKTLHEKTLAQIAKKPLSFPPSAFVTPYVISSMKPTPLTTMEPMPMQSDYSATGSEAQAQRQMQATYVANMGPATRNVPSFSVPPGFAPVISNPPMLPSSNDDIRMILPNPPPTVPLLSLLTPLVQTPPPLNRPTFTLNSSPVNIKKSDSSQVANNLSNPTVENNLHEPLLVETKTEIPRKLTMSEVVKLHLTTLKNKEESKKSPPFDLQDGLPSGDSNIEECYNKVLALVTNPFQPFLVKAPQQVKDFPKLETAEAERIMFALYCIFEGDVAAIRHEHLETAKTFFEGSNYTPLKSIKVTNERIIELITLNPNAMGVCLAYMLRSGDNSVFDFILELISSNFCPMTVVVLVRFVFEKFRHYETFNNHAFVDKVITTCLTYLNDPIIQEMRTSVEGRLVRLVVTLLYMYVLFIPNVVEHRMNELLATTSRYTSLRFAINIYHGITNYRKKKT